MVMLTEQMFSGSSRKDPTWEFDWLINWLILPYTALHIPGLMAPSSFYISGRQISDYLIINPNIFF